MRKIEMTNLKGKMKALSKKELGATMVEYAIMVALIAMVAIAMVRGLGTTVNNTYSTLNSAMINPG
jgi:pilus assembly protein Flp/PilA